MRVICVGGGPAGLCTALLLRRHRPDAEVTVLERNPAGATHGWGVVFWDDLLDDLHRSDAALARDVRAAAHLWRGQEVRLPGGRHAHLGGDGFSIGRARLLGVLAARAADVGVELRFSHEVTPDDLAGADLVVAADGVGSGLREQRRAAFGTQIRTGGNHYAWLGTPTELGPFTFAFERTGAGWIWFHGYPAGGGMSTCVVECPSDTWAGLGLDHRSAAESTALLGEVFAPHLRGRPLLDRPAGAPEPSTWQRFREVRNATWVADNVVLVGDAAHTTHFSVGAGTRLAVADAVELADQVTRHGTDLPAALAAYDTRRRQAMLARQAAAHESMEWFETVAETLDATDRDGDVVEFAYALWARRDDDLPAWRYHLHRATQHGGVRRVRRGVTALRRTVRERRRERG